jgi:hypothetical protein
MRIQSHALAPFHRVHLFLFFVHGIYHVHVIYACMCTQRYFIFMYYIIYLHTFSQTNKQTNKYAVYKMHTEILHILILCMYVLS